MKKENKKDFLFKEVKKESTSNTKGLSDDGIIILDILIKSIPVILVLIGIVRFATILAVQARNTLHEITVESRIAVVETSDTANSNNHSAEDSIFGFLIGYYTHCILSEE